MSKKVKTEESAVAETPVQKPAPAKPVDGLLAKKLAAQAKLMKSYNSSGCVGTELKAPEFYPTGLPVFDQEVIGIGGLPKGRLVEIYGPKSSGKTALSLHLCGAVQRQDASATIKIYDLERSCTPAWLTSMGIDLNRTTVEKPVTAEVMGSMIQADLALGELAPNIIIIDSIAVVQTAGVMEKEFEDLTMRDNLARAAFLTEFFNSLTFGFWYPPAGSDKKLSKDAVKVSLADTPTTILCINHAKQRTKVIGGGKSIMEWYSVGGVALDFHACMQLMVTRRGFEEGTDGNVSHQKVHVCADKNKVAAPKRECEMLLSFKGGMTQIGGIDWLTVAINRGLAEKQGGWVKSHVLLKDGKIQGSDNFNKYIEAHEEVKKLLID